MAKKKLVVLTGAGISAESGLKTFRDEDGLWEGYDLNQVATATAWRRDPSLVLEFYNLRRRSVLEAQPNAAHRALAALEKDFDVHIITQNIDDLHERGGSRSVLHLHGEIMKMRSVMLEDVLYDYNEDIFLGDCAPDGGQLRPHIVLFEEPVPMIEAAALVVRSAEVFVVIGTSLAVYPAAGLVNYAPWHIPTFIIDKKIPSASVRYNVTPIEKSATAGMSDLFHELKKLDM